MIISVMNAWYIALNAYCTMHWCNAMGNWKLRRGSIIMAPSLLQFWPLSAWTAKVNSVATSYGTSDKLWCICLVSLEWRRLFSLWRCTTVITSAHRWWAWKHWRFCYKEHSASRHCVSNYTGLATHSQTPCRFSSQHLLQPLLWCHIQLLRAEDEIDMIYKTYVLQSAIHKLCMMYRIYSFRVQLSMNNSRLLPL